MLPRGLSRRRLLAAPLLGASTTASNVMTGCFGHQAPAAHVARDTDLRIVAVSHSFQQFRYRAPYMFGGRKVSETTLLDVRCRVRTGGGREAEGFGSMTMGNAWAFPAASHEVGLAALKGMAERFARITAACDVSGHPMDLSRALEPAYLAAAAELSRAQAATLPGPIPKLAVLVAASAFDAALHDAYGKAFGVSVYETYGSKFMAQDLSRDLGPDFRGEFPDRYLLVRPADNTPVFHSIGAADPLERAEVKAPLGDGLPSAFEEWIPRDGLFRFKIKLNGGNLAADLARTVAIDAIVARSLPARGVASWKYCLDFNEGCPNVDYLLEYLHKLREATPGGFERILYIEQPTSRDLDKDPGFTLHAAAKLRPIVVDEALTDNEALLRARDKGYTGVALKACKGQTHAILMAAAARKYGLFITVQDLTCPGASLIHSAGIAARVPGNAGIEANARQFVPAANAAWEARFPGLFTIRNGVMKTGQLTGVGLGAV
jgi:L-alanine-DL-glutamate epimerase-like enolase superfamily enzyme